MGKKKSFYFSDKDIEMYEQVKLYAGESLSSIVTDAFKEFLRKRQLDEKQYAPVKVWRGSKDLQNDIADIEQFKFTGRELASASRYEGLPDDTKYVLYETKKKQYLVSWYVFDRDQATEKADFLVEKDMKGLRTHNLPDSLLVDAEKFMGEAHYVELDV